MSQTTIDVALIGETAPMLAVKDTIRRLKESPRTPVVITGESGSGKDAVARAIHSVTAPSGPFVYVSPQALDEPGLDAELFGVEGGAGDGGRKGLVEQARLGTLFIDEVSDVPAAIQGKLARFLEDGTFRPLGAAVTRTSEARVIASSTEDLTTLVENGTLKPDFAYRLGVVSLEVPPLRQRRTDIPLLVAHLLPMLAERLGKPLPKVSPGAMNMLMGHRWPGNVRELSNVLERTVLLGAPEVIEARHLSIPASPTAAVRYRLPPEGIDFRSLEKEVVMQALRISRGNQTRAATLLGMTRDQIRYRMAKFGMSTHDALAEEGGPGIRPTNGAAPPLPSGIRAA